MHIISAETKIPSSIIASLKKLNTTETIIKQKLIKKKTSLAKKCVCFQINSVSFVHLKFKAGRLKYGTFLSFIENIKNIIAIGKNIESEIGTSQIAPISSDSAKHKYVRQIVF